MSLMAWIDYGSILIFFVAMVLLIIVIGRPRQQGKALRVSTTQQALYEEKKTTYIALAILCLFLVCLALATSKHSSA